MGTREAKIAVPAGGPLTSSNPRLLDRVRVTARALRYSLRTEDAYVVWIRRFILFHGKRHPLEIGAAEIHAFLAPLAVDGHVAASTQTQGRLALLFLYKAVLEVERPACLHRCPNRRL